MIESCSQFSVAGVNALLMVVKTMFCRWKLDPSNVDMRFLLFVVLSAEINKQDFFLNNIRVYKTLLYFMFPILEEIHIPL